MGELGKLRKGPRSGLVQHLNSAHARLRGAREPKQSSLTTCFNATFQTYPTTTQNTKSSMRVINFFHSTLFWLQNCLVIDLITLSLTLPWQIKKLNNIQIIKTGIQFAKAKINCIFIQLNAIYPQGVCDIFQPFYESPSKRVAYT